MGAYRKINQTGGAKCLMKIKNLKTKTNESINVFVRNMDFEIHSYFFDKPIELKPGEPLQFHPTEALGEMYEISANTQEFAGSDGT